MEQTPEAALETLGWVRRPIQAIMGTVPWLLGGGASSSPSECPKAVEKVDVGADGVSARRPPVSSLDGGTLFAPMSHKGVS